jgi:hypothetical protein
VKPDDILIAVQDLTERERIEFLPLAPDNRQSCREFSHGLAIC